MGIISSQERRDFQMMSLLLSFTLFFFFFWFFVLFGLVQGLAPRSSCGTRVKNHEDSLQEASGREGGTPPGMDHWAWAGGGGTETPKPMVQGGTVLGRSA